MLIGQKIAISNIIAYLKINLCYGEMFMNFRDINIRDLPIKKIVYISIICIFLVCQGFSERVQQYEKNYGTIEQVGLKDAKGILGIFSAFNSNTIAKFYNYSADSNGHLTNWHIDINWRKNAAIAIACTRIWPCLWLK